LVMMMRIENDDDDDKDNDDDINDDDDDDDDDGIRICLVTAFTHFTLIVWLDIYLGYPYSYYIGIHIS